MNIKKLLAGTTVVTLVATQAMTGLTAVSAASINEEIAAAVNFMKTEGLSSVANSVEQFKPYDSVYRQTAAKFFVEFAKKEFNKKADATKVCTFKDLDKAATDEFRKYIKEACQMWLMHGDKGYFYPTRKITKLSFLTVLARIVKNNPKIEPVDAFNIMKAEWITKVNSIKDVIKPISRWELAVLFRRAVEKYATAQKEDNTNNNSNGDIADVISSVLGGDNNNNQATTGNTNTDNNQATTGDTNNQTTPAGEDKLVVAVDPATPASTDLPKGADGVKVLTIDLTAGSKDVSISEIKLKRYGFGSDTVEKAAAYVNWKRVSKSKSFNLDDEANVLVSPAYVVKAGETAKVDIIVNTDDTEIGEFTVAVEGIVAGDASVEGLPVVSNKFETKNQEATQLEFNTGSVNSTVTLWEKAADVAEFDLKNAGNVDNSDVIVSSITLKEEGTVDQENDLSNFVLINNGKEVAKVEKMSGKYITFVLNNPITIKDGKTETFKVKADIDGWADKTIKFVLDSDGDIIANATKYYAVNVVKNYAGDEVTINAGDVAIYAIDVENDKVRDDTNNVKLGTLKIVNVAGKTLNLKNLWFNVKIAGNTTWVTGGTLVLENVEAVVNGTSYDLCSEVRGTGDHICSDSDVDITLPEGTTYIDVVADVQDNMPDGLTIKLSQNVTDDTLYIEETEDDTKVTDITPSSLTWDDIEIKQPKATLSKTTLADITRVKGTENLVALQYDVEANEVSSLSIDKVKVNVKVLSGSTELTNRKDYVTQVTLYKDSVSDANKLDSVAGTKIGTDGTVEFDGFTVNVEKDATKTFIVTVSLGDSDEVVGKTVVVSYVDMDIDDDTNDPVIKEWIVGEGRKITIKGSGQVIVDLTGSVANAENESDKVLLAWESTDVFSLNIHAKNEAIDVDEFKLEISSDSDSSDLKDAINEVKVTLGNKTVVAKNSDITTATGYVTVKFDNLDGFIIPTENSKLVVNISTNSIGEEKVGKSVENVKVARFYVSKDDTKGVESNEKLSDDIDVDTTSVAKSTDVLPLIVTPAVTDKFGTDDKNATIKLSVNAGNNTDSEGNPLTATLSAIKLSVTSLTRNGTVTVFNGNGDQVATASVGGNGTVTINLTAGDVISQDEEYRIETTAEASFRLEKDGIVYKVNNTTYSTKLDNTEDLGSYSKSN